MLIENLFVGANVGANEALRNAPSLRARPGRSPVALPRATFVHPDDYERLRLLNQGISPANPQFTSVHRLRHKNGCYLWVEAAFRLTETSLGEPIILGPIRDVSERHRQSEALKAAKAAADEANAAKTDFLATMRHEIRTPLNGILGYTELLLDDASLTPKQTRSLERLESAGAALLTVVNDVLASC